MSWSLNRGWNSVNLVLILAVLLQVRFWIERLLASQSLVPQPRRQEPDRQRALQHLASHHNYLRRLILARLEEASLGVELEDVIPFNYIMINAVYRLVSWDSIVKKTQKYLSVLWMGGWASIVKSFFSDPIFSGEALSTFIYTPFFGKAGPFTLESHIHVKALKMQGFPNN